MAFALVGTNGALDGITFDPSAEKNVAIRNGSVRGWGGRGINLSGGLDGVSIEHIRAADNALEGITVPSHSVAHQCIAMGNGASGFLVLLNAVVESCIAEGNGGDGIRAIGVGGTIRSCASAYNTDSGIYADNGWTIVQCSTSFNGANGIETIYENTILDCTATANTAAGIWGGRLVANCTASANQGDGILAIGTSVVRNNCCKQNVGAGVHLTGGDVRVDGNNVTYNSIGIDVDMPGNLIVRNAAAENSINNYDIVAGNRYGQVIDLTIGGAPPAVLGSGSAVNTVNNTNPWANFSY
jgi:hypothetical protein